MEIMKRIKRTIILALCLVLCGTVIPALGENAGEKSRISSPEEAEFFVRTLLGETPDLLDGQYLLSEMMDQAVAGSGGFSGIAKQLAGLGELNEISPAYAEKTAGLTVYRVPCRFSTAELDIVMPLDSEGAIAGLVTDWYTGPAKPENTEDRHYSETELFLPVPELNGEAAWEIMRTIEEQGYYDSDRSVPFLDSDFSDYLVKEDYVTTIRYRAYSTPSCISAAWSGCCSWANSAGRHRSAATCARNCLICVSVISMR